MADLILTGRQLKTALIKIISLFSARFQHGAGTGFAQSGARFSLKINLALNAGFSVACVSGMVFAVSAPGRENDGMEAELSVKKKIAEKMRAAGQSEAAIAAFLQAVERVLSGEQGFWPEEAIEPARELPEWDELAPCTAQGAPWEKLAIIKLNGGLGTTMGLQGPKSLLKVKGDTCFLDFIALQVLHLRGGRPFPRFYLMNSFHTREATLDYLRRYPELSGTGEPLDFLQSQVPKLDVSTLAPVEWPADPRLEWCPPGHGDIYAALAGASLLRQFRAEGIEYLFVSNVDNLGAVPDGRLLRWFADSGHAFVMEVTHRLAVDSKGGHLARRRDNGRLILREASQCPDEDRPYFEDPKRHRYFNTNNLWLRVSELMGALERHGGALPLPLIRNRKPVDPQQPDSPPVLQLESAMGAAIECFERAAAVVVPRSRFVPVKNTEDLLAVRSDAYAVSADHRLELAAARKGEPPQISLDPEYYRLLPDFERAFPEGPPSLVACGRMQVKGPCVFSANVRCEGKVVFKNLQKIPRGVPCGVYRDTEVVL